MGKDEYGSLVARARESNDQNSNAEFQRANGCSKNCGTKHLTFFCCFITKRRALQSINDLQTSVPRDSSQSHSSTGLEKMQHLRFKLSCIHVCNLILLLMAQHFLRHAPTQDLIYTWHVQICCSTNYNTIYNLH